ncbi:integration host factor subunit alpha [Acidithiobacillus sp. MC6.1]|nr:integration host factor subunit alpha [Acidithiobacillus sp. MC6.1]
MTVTKKDLTDLLSQSIGLTAREGKEVVESFFDHIRAALASGDNVLLSGFGVFRLRDKPSRPGRNPRNGEAFEIAARRVVTFRTSQKMKAKVLNHT